MYNKAVNIPLITKSLLSYIEILHDIIQVSLLFSHLLNLNLHNN